jgi:ABC-2 type transport system ATP-binding protein
MANPVLTIESVAYRYAGKVALDDVSLQLDGGTFTALLGPNGAGKTTLISLICRLLEPRQGSIRICGEDIATSATRALRQVGIVFQQPTLDLDLSVRQNLQYFAALRGMSRANAGSRIAAEIERLDIGDISSKPVRQLNGGHRRRVEIARALLHQPQLLILDEPTVGLDIPTRQQFVSYTHELARERGVCVFWASHLIDEVDSQRDNVVILHQGRVHANGQAEALLAQEACENLSALYCKLTGEVQS